MGRRLVAEREKQRTLTTIITSPLSPTPILHVNDTLTLNKDEASYDLSIEIPQSIDSITFQCDCPIEILTKEDIKLGEINPLEGIHLMAIYRPKLRSNRADIKFRAVEGQHGTLQAVILPINSPVLDEARKYIIKPLSLHMRIHKDDVVSRPFNTLTLKGNFSQAEMHSWLNNCIPEMPERIGQGDSVPLLFKHVFATTILNCEFR